MFCYPQIFQPQNEAIAMQNHVINQDAKILGKDSNLVTRKIKKPSR